MHRYTLKTTQKDVNKYQKKQIAVSIVSTAKTTIKENRHRL